MKSALLFSLIFGLGAGVFPEAASSSGSYEVCIIQNGIRYPVLPGRQNVIRLKPEPFQFEYRLRGLEGIMMLACTSDTFYNTPDTSELPTCMMLEGIAAAEYEGNPEHSMFVAEQYDDGANYWYAESEKTGRFDRVESWSSDSFTAIRTVEKLRYAGMKNKLKKIEKMRDSLYLVFINLKSERCAYYNWKQIPDRRYVNLQFSGY